MREYEKIQATTKLLSELAKGESSGLDVGWLPADDVEIKLGFSHE